MHGEAGKGDRTRPRSSHCTQAQWEKNWQRAFGDQVCTLCGHDLVDGEFGVCEACYNEKLEER